MLIKPLTHSDIEPFLQHVTRDMSESGRGNALDVACVSNLIQNALKYTHTGGRIQVRGSNAGEHILIEVEDVCGGLPNSAENLFKPYVQQHEDRQGLGLGLTIAQRAVALIHGKIEVTSLPGKGCIFQIRLPKKISQGKLKAEPAA